MNHPYLAPFWERLDNNLTPDILRSVNDEEAYIESTVVFRMLCKYADNARERDNVKIAVLHPEFLGRYFAPDIAGYGIELLNRDDEETRAYNYLYGDREDFELLLIPIHTRITDVAVSEDQRWRIGQHWMLGIFDRQGAGGREFCYVYDSFNRNIDKNVRNVLRRVFNTIIPGQRISARIDKPRNAYNLQTDGYSCGVFIIHYAEQYIRERRVFFDENFNVMQKRQAILELMEQHYMEEVDANYLLLTPDPTQEDRPTTSVQRDRQAKHVSVDRIAVLSAEANAVEKEIKREQSKKGMKRLRKNQTPEQREQDRQKIRKLVQQLRENQTPEQREQNRQEIRKLVQQLRENQTPEHREQDRQETRKRVQQLRENQTPERQETERIKSRDRKRIYRANETPGQYRRRIVEQRHRQARMRHLQSQKDANPFYKAAMDSSGVSYHKLGPFDVKCVHDGSFHFPEERISGKHDTDSFYSCCNHGRIYLDHDDDFPNELELLFLNEDQHSREFKARIINLNGNYAMASINVDNNKTVPSGIYAYKIQGNVYHKINTAAYATQTPSYLQMYFIDEGQAIEYRKEHDYNRGISTDLIERLERIFRTYNRFVDTFQTMKEVEQQVNDEAMRNGIVPPKVNLVFQLDKKTDLRRYNIPITTDMAAVMVIGEDGSIPEHELIIHQRGKELKTMNHLNSKVDPFCYPFLFPTGMLGWEPKIPMVRPYGRQKHVTRAEFIRYRLAFRKTFDYGIPEWHYPTEEDNDDEPSVAQRLAMNTEDEVPPSIYFRSTVPKPIPKCLMPYVIDYYHASAEFPFNPLHFSEKLFQQYVVDCSVRMERDKINWIKKNQERIKAGQYEAVNKYLREIASKENATIDKQPVIMPSSFTGGPRYYDGYYEDASAYVPKFGPPDLFITMTCNSKWPEIREACTHTFPSGKKLKQFYNHRPDIVARVFRLKSQQLIDDIVKKEIFGKVAAYSSVIEFQKRGLPHMHMLVILDGKDKIRTPQQVDDFIKAELPPLPEGTLKDWMLDPEKFAQYEFWKLVDDLMIHDPCGKDNPNAYCMRNGQCRFHYPKKHNKKTVVKEGEFPIYRRRQIPNKDVFNVVRKTHDGKPVIRDNRHVVPYNEYLLKKYQCHINVEAVGSVHAVRYLYKYIFKGHDKAIVRVVNDEKKIIYDECERYIDARYLTAPEALWRILEFPLMQRSHNVERLDIHDKGQYRPLDGDQVPENLADVGQKRSKLEAWFDLNKKDTNARQYTYVQIPQYYTWHGNKSEWSKRGGGKAIGRIYTVSPALPEKYHLRILLHHVKGATSFEDLLNGCRTYKEACLKLGLVKNDDEWRACLREESNHKFAPAMRTLFTTILIFNSPANPLELWEEFKEELAYDFIYPEIRKPPEDRSPNYKERAIERAYRIIAGKLNENATEGRTFEYWVRHYGFPAIAEFEEEPDNAIPLAIDEIEQLAQELYHSVASNPEQKAAVDAILQAADEGGNKPRCFFIEGPGGTGKTHVYKCLYYNLLAKKLRSQNMATTGVAANLLIKGQTAHKTFALDVPLRNNSVSKIKAGTTKGDNLAVIDAFFLDEAPMLSKYGVENIDAKLKELHDPDFPVGLPSHIAFGGAIVVLGGDFRQCLPVQTGSTGSELRQLSIKYSYLWNKFKIFELKKNMRVDEEEVWWKDYILRIGNGAEKANEYGEIKLPDDIISGGDLVEDVFGLCLRNQDYDGMSSRAILTPYNREANVHNKSVIMRLPGNLHTLLSYDTVRDELPGCMQYRTEFLNSIDHPDLPPHRLELKKNAIIMLMRNIDVQNGLCNGTRLQVVNIENNELRAKVLTGSSKGKIMAIPRITLETNKGIGFTLSRHQFPVKPAFAMTIHKAQGQTLEFVGIDLTYDVFSHGQLYVAFSRVKRQSAIKVLLSKDKTENITLNIVDKMILRDKIPIEELEPEMEIDLEENFADEVESEELEMNEFDVPTIDPREDLIEEEDDFSQEL